MTIKLLLVAFIGIGIVLPCQSQDNYAPLDNIVALPTKFISKVNKRIGELESNLEKQTAKYLAKLKKQEARLKRKLAKKDSVASNEIFGHASQKYSELALKLRSPQKYKDYIPYLDTLSTSLRFLEKYNLISNNPGDVNQRFKSAYSNIQDLESRLQKAEIIKHFMRERKEFLRNQLASFGFGKELQKLNKDVYYYGQYINEYKALLQNPEKLERKAIELLSKTAFFQDFLRKNSFLASIFSVPNDPGSAAYQANMAGLQTRTQVSQQMQWQFGTRSPAAPQTFQQNIQQAQSQLQNLKNRISQLGGNVDGGEMPNFKPNKQKTRSFLQRLEIGANIQTQRASYYFPAISDIGLSLGYKLNDKSVIGTGISYALGLGSGWRDIKFTSQGMGLRSFLDWKLKRSLWISGGFEMNYRSEFTNIDQLKKVNAWQQSGLLGISKVIATKAKFLNKTKLSILWDFLSYSQSPQTSAFKFRIGYLLR